MKPELEPFEYDSLSYSTALRRTGFRRPRINWTNVASWSLAQNTKEAILEEISSLSKTFYIHVHTCYIHVLDFINLYVFTIYTFIR